MSITYRQLFSIMNKIMTDEQLDSPIQIMDADGDITTIDSCESEVVVNAYNQRVNRYFLRF